MTDGHAPLAPSAAHQWSHCSGSVRLQQQYPEDGGAEGEEGTAAHWLAAQSISGVSPLRLDVSPEGYLITSEMRAHVAVYADYVVDTRPADRNVEQRLVCSSIHQDAWGTCDLYSLDRVRKIAFIDDFKYGYGLVEAFENPQLICYASGVYDLVGPDAIEWTFVLTIFQPRPYHRQGPMRSWSISGPELRNHVRHLRTQAEEALGNNPVTAIGSHCKHCSARHVCGALQAASLDAVDLAYDATPAELPPAALDLEMRVLLRAHAHLEARIAGLSVQAMAAIRSGISVPGWTIEHPPGREEWVRPASEIIALGGAMGVSLAKPSDVITPNQARTAGLTKEIVAAYSARGKGSAKLVPISLTAAKEAFGG